jgi:SAM-dependent methyltransferase
VTRSSIDYSEMASLYARHRQVHPEVLRSLLEHVGPATRLLEVGCGTGHYLVAVCEAVGCRGWGIDPSPEMLAKARGLSGGVGLSVGRAESLAFPSSTFDLVFSVDVIHHVHDRSAYFQEAERVLRAGGQVCTVTDSGWVIRHRQPLAVYFPETVDADLARYPTLDELRAAMTEAGFEGIQEHTVEFQGEVTDLGPYRDRAYSCLRLISDEAFRRGLARMEADARAGPIAWVPRYSLLWGTRTEGIPER